MTEGQFIDFCKNNKPVKIEPEEWYGHTIHFENGEWVKVGSNYDGIYYTHSAEPIPDSTELVNELMLTSEQHIKNIQEKYGSDSYPFLLSILTNPNPQT